jgi:hypothetical protein
VRRRPVLAWLIYAGLTLPIGLFGHVLFEASGGVVRRLGDIELDHIILFTCAALAFAFTVGALRRGNARDRKRRLALLRAALPGRSQLLLTGIAGQGLVAAATLGLEGIEVDPSRVVVALAVALIGILLGAMAFESVEADLIAILVAFAVALFGEGAPLRVSIADGLFAHTGRTPIRVHAGRAPPSSPSPLP